VIPIVLACNAESQPERSQGRARSGTAAEGPIIPTAEMSQELTRDVRASEHELTTLKDSLYQLMGDTVSRLLKQADSSWNAYRKLECDAVRLAFAQGSIAPVAHLECWVGLTDGRRRFLSAEYDFARPPGSAAPGRP
jgi:uncharacterized protein YecT (DUF1311 family)